MSDVNGLLPSQRRYAHRCFIRTCITVQFSLPWPPWAFSRLILITALPLVHSAASSVRLGGERQPTPPTPEHALPPNRDPGLMSFVDTQDAGLPFCHTDTTTSPHWLLTSDHYPPIPTDQIFENVVLGPELMPTRPVPADAPLSSRLATEASLSRDTPDALASWSGWTDLEPLESRSARQSSRSLVKVFVLGAWVVPEPVRRHQSRTIPPQLRELHTGLPDIPCKLQALPPHFERMANQPKPLGPSCQQLWTIGNHIDKLPFEHWVHRPPRPENGRPGIGRERDGFEVHAGNDDMRTWARHVADPSSWSPFPSHADPGIPITTRSRSEGDSWLYSVPTSSGLILTGLRPPWHHVGCVRRLRSREARIMQPRPG